MRFSARRNCPRERWGWRRQIGKAFHRRGPATPNAWNARSPRHVRVRGIKHVTASDDLSWRRPAAATSWQSSFKHCGACPCSALNTSVWATSAIGLFQQIVTTLRFEQLDYNQRCPECFQQHALLFFLFQKSKFWGLCIGEGVQIIRLLAQHSWWVDSTLLYIGRS